MAFYRRWLLIFCVLLGGGAVALAASPRENRAYAAAADLFKTGLWSRAETGFSRFTQQYPNSTNAPMAVLLEAQAQFKQGKFPESITLLTSRRKRAGVLADQYVSWIGEAQFAGSNYLAAAETFTSLVDEFPDSPLRLSAAVEAAAAYDRREDWQKIVVVLLQTNGVFQQKADLDSDNELVSTGRLLLARAWFKLGEPGKSLAILSAMNTKSLKLRQDAQLNQIAYDDSLAAKDYGTALLDATNLVQLARLARDNVLAADGWARMADALAAAGQPGPAAAAWGQNLAAGTPDDKQVQAIWKIAELAAGQKQFGAAEQQLENYLKQFPDSPEEDIALLTDGELYLTDYVQSPATNQLAAAQAKFDQLLADFPDSPHAGKALLDRGWCLWLGGKIPDSQGAFEAALEKGLSPADLAVAQFKLGDALFAQTNYAGARENYSAVYPDVPPGGPAGQLTPEQDLRSRALYQSLRACLELGDTNQAAEMFADLFQAFAGNDLGQGSALLYGESLIDPREARGLFERLAPNFSGSPLAPQLRLAIARTYEQEADWAAAVTNYAAWVRDYPTNNLRPQADYALAQANFQAGNEAAALPLFARFVAQNPANPLAPQAQWWVADHYYRRGEYTGAETNYEAVFQNTNAVWKSSPLYYSAQLMAGRAAVGRTDYRDAVNYYFTPLINDTNCPPDVGVKARFACGSALMLLDSADTNAAQANLAMATNLFSQIVQSNPTNELGANAWGEIGDCVRQLGDYVSATNAYAQVFNPASPVKIYGRSAAQVAFAQVLEKMAAQTGGVDQTNLLNQALDNDLEVFNGVNLRDNESPDPYWVKEAGLDAAPLIGLLYDNDRELIFYQKLKQLLPQLGGQIDKKMDALSAQKK